MPLEHKEMDFGRDLAPSKNTASQGSFQFYFQPNLNTSTWSFDGNNFDQELNQNFDLLELKKDDCLTHSNYKSQKAWGNYPHLSHQDFQAPAQKYLVRLPKFHLVVCVDKPNSNYGVASLQACDRSPSHPASATTGSGYTHTNPRSNYKF